MKGSGGNGRGGVKRGEEGVGCRRTISLTAIIITTRIIITPTQLTPTISNPFLHHHHPVPKAIPLTFHLHTHPPPSSPHHQSREARMDQVGCCCAARTTSCTRTLATSPTSDAPSPDVVTTLTTQNEACFLPAPPPIAPRWNGGGVISVESF